MREYRSAGAIAIAKQTSSSPDCDTFFLTGKRTTNYTNFFEGFCGPQDSIFYQLKSLEPRPTTLKTEPLHYVFNLCDQKMVGHMMIQSFLILATLATFGLCAEYVYIVKGVNEYASNGKINLVWTGAAPMFSHAGKDSVNHRFRVHYRDGMSGSSEFTVKTAHTNWQSFQVGVEHINRDRRGAFLKIEPLD
ncbi:hypothetical protein DFH28DRAFT_1220030 [Melampsora americana]|nr:hypothetical protein DFH28DRAFT_1220030 [Melampsora americana]